MRRRSVLGALIALLPLAAGAGCFSSSNDATRDSGLSDVTLGDDASDASSDAGPPEAAVSETGNEGASSVDASIDATIDATIDSAIDAPGEGSPDSGGETGTDGAIAGHLYVVGGNYIGPSVAVFDEGATGTTAPLYTITGSFFSSPAWVALDATDGTLFVQDGASVLVFSQGATTPARTITSSALLGNVKRVGADFGGKAYVAASMLVGGVTSNGIAIFAAGAGTGATPLSTFSSAMLGTLSGIAVDASGNIFIGSSNQQGGYNLILEFAPGPSGFATASRTIGGGPNSHIGQASLGGLAVDASGNVYVSVLANASNASDSIEVYAPSVTGDQAPTREIAGSLTQLSSPTTIAVDANGDLYASNAGGAATPITVYAPGASGNQAPIRTLDPTAGGAQTGGLGMTVGP